MPSNGRRRTRPHGLLAKSFERCTEINMRLNESYINLVRFGPQLRRFSRGSQMSTSKWCSIRPGPRSNVRRCWAPARIRPRSGTRAASDPHPVPVRLAASGAGLPRRQQMQLHRLRHASEAVWACANSLHMYMIGPAWSFTFPKLPTIPFNGRGTWQIPQHGLRA